MVQILDFCNRPSEAASQGTGDEIRRGKLQERNVPSVERRWREWTASEPFLVVSSMSSADVNQSRAHSRDGHLRRTTAKWLNLNAIRIHRAHLKPFTESVSQDGLEWN
jgi:hypothetical protein